MNTFLVVVLIGLAGEPGATNEKVVAFARSKIGQKVGDGECSALASEAIRQAGAVRDGRGLGSWGEPLDSIKEARPGDILQIENATFIQRRVRPDGIVVKQTLKTPLHIAVVSAIRRRGSDVEMVVLHQNAAVIGSGEGDRKTVQAWAVSLSEMRSGTIKAFRPVAEKKIEADSVP